ncbi:MAG: hypothetical protein KJO36_04385 [Acidimicrobiia bacterium]|nr:hypothetical protein [Acidimicrobiia bacterium]MBT8251159.1 hypothetical protein [Acidimicrobiia bacterium]NNC43422.1 hypothetical protein [Acidimicrobiia bacterium]NND12853.1 hypothetical protein [Acidimicrobiia bacterium]NNL29323.1 hypothetical protein [Acidimicrobiia bacterium]
MTIWHQIRGFVRAFRVHDGTSNVQAPDSLAKTVKHGTQLRGSAGGAASTVADRIMADGHERYADSFKKDD